jgi:AAA15 family ATPase/GTPase
MNHLENLTIEQFRGIKNLTLKDLGKINILVGANNSGKTSILEAIAIYCQPLNPIELLNIAKQREIKSSRLSILETIKWLFPQKANLPEFYQGEFTIRGNGNFSLRQYKAIYHEFAGISDDNNQNIETTEIVKVAELSLEVLIENHQSSLFNEENYQPITQTFEIWENKGFINKQKSLNLTLPVATITPISHRSETLQISYLSTVIIENLKPEVIKLMQLFDPEIIDLDILSQSGTIPKIYINHQQMGLTPLSAFGDGIRRLLFIALNLVKVKNGILLIDEIETAIHTEVLVKSFVWLIQWCKEMQVQLFVTTHSLEAIDALLTATELDTDHEKNLILYRLETQEIGTKTLRIERDKLQRLRNDLGQEVRW